MNQREYVINRSKEPIGSEEINIISSSQRLWLQLAYWVRSLIITTLRDPERQHANLERLLTGVTRDFYNYFRLLYGPEVAQNVINIVSGSIVNVLNIIEGIKANNVDQVNSNTTQLYQRADLFASYLYQMNNNWDENQWKNFLYQYINLIIDQTVAMAGGYFDAEIAIQGRIEDLATIMGDYMARGVLAGLPNT